MPDADLERDRLVRRLRPADGPRLRAPRPHEPGDPRGRWIGFRQPVLRVALERDGQAVRHDVQATPRELGEVWEEDEFWIELSWQIDPDGSLGIRSTSSRPYRPGEKITVDEYYRWIFENAVPGLPEAAAKEGLTPLEYMRKYGAFVVEDDVYRATRTPLAPRGARRRRRSTRRRASSRKAARRRRRDRRPASRRLPDAVAQARVLLEDAEGLGLAGARAARLHPQPRPLVEHRPREGRDRSAADVPAADAHPHASGNAKWLYEISHTNPLWIHPEDAERLGVETGDLLQGRDARSVISWTRSWVTEGIRPGVIACSHHLGRWRLHEDAGGERWSTALVRPRRPERRASGGMRQRPRHRGRSRATTPTRSASGGRRRRPPEPDVPGPARPGQRHALLAPEGARREGRARTTATATSSWTRRSLIEVYRRWLAIARPAPGPGGPPAAAVAPARLQARPVDYRM